MTERDFWEDLEASLRSKILELADRLTKLESTRADSRLYQLSPVDADIRVPSAENVELISSEALSGATKVAIRWVKPDDPNIDRFEIWVSRTAYESSTPYLAISVKDSPAAFTVTADRDTSAVAYIRTVMKNGLGTDLNASPTVSFNVYEYVPSTEIPDGSVTDNKLDRVTAQRVLIRNSDLDRVTANRIVINDADIGNLSVSKLTAGTAVFTGDLEFRNTGNIRLFNGGAIYISPGTLHATVADFLSAGSGWNIFPGMVPTIEPKGNYNQNSTVKAAKFYAWKTGVGFVPGLTETVNIQDNLGVTHHLEFVGGVLVGHTTS